MNQVISLFQLSVDFDMHDGLHYLYKTLLKFLPFSIEVLALAHAI
jgi:hypothetical protein